MRFILCKLFKHLAHTAGGFSYILSSDLCYKMALEFRCTRTMKSKEWAGLDAPTQHWLSPPPTISCCTWLMNSAGGDFLQIRSKTHPYWFQTPVVFPPQRIPVQVLPGKSSQAAAARATGTPPVRLLPVFFLFPPGNTNGNTPTGAGSPSRNAPSPQPRCATSQRTSRPPWPTSCVSGQSSVPRGHGGAP